VIEPQSGYLRSRKKNGAIGGTFAFADKFSHFFRMVRYIKVNEWLESPALLNCPIQLYPYAQSQRTNIEVQPPTHHTPRKIPPRWSPIDAGAIRPCSIPEKFHKTSVLGRRPFKGGEALSLYIDSYRSPKSGLNRMMLILFFSPWEL
jgi:hypothetical protein